MIYTVLISVTFCCLITATTDYYIKNINTVVFWYPSSTLHSARIERIVFFF